MKIFLAVWIGVLLLCANACHSDAPSGLVVGFSGPLTGPPSSRINTATHLEWSDEFLNNGGTDWINGTASGTGATNTVITTTTRPGMLDLQTGTSTTGIVRWNTTGNWFDFGSESAASELVAGWPVLSTVTDEYESLVGFTDQVTSVNATNGCYFLEDRLPVATAPGTGTITAGSTNLQCWCASSGVRTGYTMDGAIVSQEGFTTVATPVSAMTLPSTNILRMRVVVTGTTRAEFYVDSGAGLTKRCDINTNIPSGTNRTNYAFFILKSAGTASRSFYVDSAALTLDLNIARFVDLFSSVIQRFELVANDGLESPPGSLFISNDWGGHMSRIARMNDGTIYLARLQTLNGSCCNWTLAKRTPAGVWSDVLSGTTTDEVHVVHNPITDIVSVIAYPSGLPAIWDGPSFVQQSIPGSWLNLTPASRHYGNAGMGADGTLCLKISRENGSTANTNTEYACRPSGGSWGPYVAHAIGLRHTYDYIFPNAVANGFYGSSTYDVQKDDAGWPSLAGFPYVFNGVNGYSTGTTSDTTWQQETVFPALTVPNQSAATVAPLAEQIDAFVDSGGRAFSVDIESTSNGTAQTNTGFHLSVTNPVTGANIYRGLLGVPTFGSVRIFEDDSSRLWVLWTNPGTRSMQINVDRLNETTVLGVTTFSVGHVDDLTATFVPFTPGWTYTPYQIHGPVYLAMPRGGTARSNVIDGYLDACTVQFPQDGILLRSNYNSANCFNADGLGQMSIVYFQIKLL